MTPLSEKSAEQGSSSSSTSISDTGFSGTYIYVCRSKGFGVVALANRLAFRVAHGTNTNEFRRALADAVYQQFSNRK